MVQCTGILHTTSSPSSFRGVPWLVPFFAYLPVAARPPGAAWCLKRPEMTDPQQPGTPGSDKNFPSSQDLWSQSAAPSGARAAVQEPGWERATLERLAFAALSEQRSARRWKIFFRFAWLLLIVALAWGAMRQASTGASKSTPHTAVVDIKGEIANGAESRPSSHYRIADPPDVGGGRLADLLPVTYRHSQAHPKKSNPAAPPRPPTHNLAPNQPSEFNALTPTLRFRSDAAPIAAIMAPLPALLRRANAAALADPDARCPPLHCLHPLHHFFAVQSHPARHETWPET